MGLLVGLYNGQNDSISADSADKCYRHIWISSITDNH